MQLLRAIVMATYSVENRNKFPTQQSLENDAEMRDWALDCSRRSGNEIVQLGLGMRADNADMQQCHPAGREPVREANSKSKPSVSTRGDE